MLFMFLIALGLVTIGAYATPTARTVGGLEVSLSTPTEKVASPSEIRVIATVRNVGDQDLKVVKFGTVLDDDLRTPSFIIRKDGKEVHFTRIAMVSELMNRLAENHPSEDDWVVIKAGETARAEHNVSTAYDFSTSGPGAFTLDSISRFRVAGLDGTFETTIADTHAATVIVTDDISERKLDLRTVNVDCPIKPDWAALLEGGLRDARFLALIADFYVYQHGPDDPLYKGYFGNSDPKTVMLNWGYILTGGPSTKLYCQTMSSECEYDLVYSHDNKGFYFCSYFFFSSSHHQLCHGAGLISGIGGGDVIAALAVAAIQGAEFKYDTGYGHGDCDFAQKHASGDKLLNAFGYRCFALQVYMNTRCN